MIGVRLKNLVPVDCAQLLNQGVGAVAAVGLVKVEKLYGTGEAEENQARSSE